MSVQLAEHRPGAGEAVRIAVVGLARESATSGVEI